MQRLNIDEIKIDRCFVSGIQFNNYNYRLLKNILELAGTSQIQVCCEGVEQEEELEVLEELRPDLLQGYLFSKPCESQVFEEKYLKNLGKTYLKVARVNGQIQQQLLKEKLKGECNEILKFSYKNILQATNLGLWIIRIDPKEERYEMYADKTMQSAMGLEKELSVEECYRYWYSCINDGYYNYVSQSVESIVQSGKTMQIQYTWNHPVQGEVMVRCTGVRMENSDGMICLAGYHKVVSNIEQSEFIKDEPSSERFEYNERKKTIYFHTKRALISGNDMHEHNFPEQWLNSGIVHPHFAETFRDIFHNVQDKPNVDGVELMMKSKQDSYSWFKLNTRHLGDADSDRNTILVQLNSANRERCMELENMRIMDFYHASLSETIAYAELDMESGHIQAVGGLWADFDRKCNGDAMVFLQYLIEYQHAHVPNKGNEKLKICSDVKELNSMIQNGKRTQRFIYKCLISKEWRWVELVIHTFNEQFSNNMYALLYMNDIDVKMNHEIMQQEAAEKDPLTMVYNRKRFEELVNQVLNGKSQEENGAIILFDIDNFKLINDQAGHLIGDIVLKHMAKCLVDVFGEQGIVGRFGGDEFLVFLKGEQQKQQISKHMEVLFKMLGKNIDIQVNSSVGIVILDEEHVSYEEAMNRVDEALYCSKRNGKNQYSYWK